jgi:hypothetical protein
MGSPRWAWDHVRKLKRKLARRKQRVDADLRRESTLPATVFDCQEPMVEAALMDAAASLLLQRLSVDAPTDRTGPTVDHAEVVTEAELKAFWNQLPRLAVAPPPAIAADLGSERLWVLIDMSRHGNGLARQRASTELRPLLHHLVRRGEMDAPALRRLIERLRAAQVRQRAPVLLRALMRQAQALLQNGVALDRASIRAAEALQPRTPWPT